MTPSARQASVQILTACRRGGAWADGALKTTIEKEHLSPADARLTTRIVYGVMQNRMLIDHWIGACCAQKPEQLEPVLLDILRIGAYQILFLERIPDSAAVNESVNLAKGCGKGRASGLVNAVLRRISREKDQPLKLPQEEAERLSILYSHPVWLVKRLLQLLGKEETEAFLKENNAGAPLAVQVNSLKTSPQALKEALEAEGVEVSAHPWLSNCLILSGTGNLSALNAFRNGWFWVQDPGAWLMAFAAQPHGFVIDMCAAPGGKSFASAALMAGKGRICSCDIHPHKLKLIEAGARRLGIENLETALQDGRTERPEWRAAADTVLVDAPCSGLGIIRKKPDIRYKDPALLSGLPQIQQAILRNAAGYVKPGGTLVYSTCTILPEENEQIIAEFLHTHPQFYKEAFSLPFGQVTEGDITLWPQRCGTDGFYICRMRRMEHD